MLLALTARHRARRHDCIKHCPCSIRALLWPRGASMRSASSIPRVQWRNPVMFVVYIGSILTTVLWVQALGGARRGAGLVHPQRRALAVVHGAVRELRRGAGRGPQQGAGRVAARPEADGDAPRSSPMPRPQRRSPQRARPTELRKGDVVLVEAGDYDPGRRRGDRRRGLGGRERHHRRIGAGDPRIRRRLLRGHRRHARAVGLDHGARHGESRRDLPRPHDRDGGERQAPEDAERDRADHSAGRADPRVPARHRHAAAVSRFTASRWRSWVRRSRSRRWSRCWCA